MKSIESKEELWGAIAKLRKVGLREIISNEGRTFSGELSDIVSKQGIKNNFTSALFKLNYQGQKISVKTPRLLGYVTILMCLTFENYLNQNFLVTEGLTSSTMREFQTYSYLSKKGFPTFNPREDLLMDEKGVLRFNDVLITDWVDGINGVDLLANTTKNGAESYVFNVNQRLCELHGNNVIWGDPSPRNSMETKSGLIIYDFGLLKPNNEKPPTFLMVKDLVTLLLTSKYCAGLQNELGIEDVAIEGYKPDKQMRYALKKQMLADLKSYNIARLNPLEILFSKIKYGLSVEQVQESKERILKLVS